MYDEIKVTYLLNSGFILELGDCAMIFDYYQDPNNLVPKIIQDKHEVYFFVSHAHYDHFNPQIKNFIQNTTKYFISYDVKNNLPTADKTIMLEEYMSYDDKNIHVKTFSSTDEGVCFYIEKYGWKIFHAGDFNWWHWKGDTEENNAFARNGFIKQLKRMHGLSLDIAFFPVDRRQEEFWDLGAKNFCEQVEVKNLITMHNVGNEKWIAPEDFPHKKEMKSIWSPEHTGEFHIIKR